MKSGFLIFACIFLASAVQAQVGGTFHRLHNLKARPEGTNAPPPIQGQWDVRMNSATVPAGQGGAQTEFTFDIENDVIAGTTEIVTNSNATDPTIALTDHEFSNSACVASGGGDVVSATGNYPSSVAFTINVDNGESYTLTGIYQSDGVTTTVTGTASYTGSSGCGSNDSGQPFTATLYNAASGTYAGTFTQDGTSSTFSSSITLTQDANFDLTGTVTSTGNSCFTNLTVDSSVYESLVSGNVAEFYGTDETGDLIGFVANTGGSTDASGDTTWSNVYVTAFGLTGPCIGLSYTDAPFHKVVIQRAPPPLPARPVGLPIRGGFRFIL